MQTQVLHQDELHAKQNHKFEGGHYVPVALEHQEYPKMLFHPKYGSVALPQLNDYGYGDKVDRRAYDQAVKKFNDANRTLTVQNAKEEDKYVKKGWLAKRPEITVEAAKPADEI